MQSLLGILAFVCRIMQVGSIFSCRLYLSISGLKLPLAHIRLTSPFKEDLLVWSNFLNCYNGQSFFQADFILAPDFCLFTDAAGSKGFGAIWKSNWCCTAWPESWVRMRATNNVVLLDLFPILVALELWGLDFANRRILVRTDNKVVFICSKLPLVEFLVGDQSARAGCLFF